MRSWLASPTVAFLGFLSTVITIVQAVFIVAKWANEFRQAKDKQRRISMAVIWFCFSYVAVIAPLSWSVITAEAAKAGNPGWQAALYPVMVNGLSLVGALVMVSEVKAKRGLSLLPFGTAFFGLASATGMYIAGASEWMNLFIAAIPSVAIGAVPLFIVHSRKLPHGGANSEQGTTA
jgi:hypothetical protein